MDSIDKVNQEYIRRKFFEDDSECVEDLTSGYGCLFWGLIIVAFVSVFIIIKKIGK